MSQVLQLPADEESSVAYAQKKIIEPLSEIHHTCHDPGCKDPTHWRAVHSACNKKEAGRQSRAIKNPRVRLGRKQYADTLILLYREQKGTCYLCGQKGSLSMESVTLKKERENKPAAGLHQPLIAEIDISTTLFPWYEDWLDDHVPRGPGGAPCTFNQAIYVAAREAKATFGYGSPEVLREYLKTLTTPNRRGKTPYVVNRADTAIGKHIIRGNWP